MRDKRDEPDSGKITGFFDKNTEMKGELKFSGSFQIDGRYSGTIDSKSTLVIGENGKVEADVNIAVIVINGEINATGRVIGSIMAPHLIVKEGAYLEASCHTTDKIPQKEIQEIKEIPEPENPEKKGGFLS
jgi:cytoskeletal protein CcmA (bactofilin family)